MGLFIEMRTIIAFEISIHPSRVGWDARKLYNDMEKFLFQSTHPVWDGTRSKFLRSYLPEHFNPPIPCGMGHVDNWKETLYNEDFNPPIPCGMGL